ncbi:polyketide beta-ketoacyl:ACP synthase [Pseudoalteromonas luteoviolacea]|uniref:Polyketide beta-ketoacyl:ACP synthase n=1 Tax=Pseudoalteromonas luteoviolacea TaxID=43657 RepID=A0A1C0TJW7_9GAMM|nr:beta-ketoacyl synthase N-terminal-like domain-containing protein [Pseudoalteromonas luteoviolacea]OCQ18824.1 polyketide beta-ketoacyl:ACP synthase [Pseudoalteromonas luteoviolacea]
MSNMSFDPVCITGVGITTGNGQGKEAVMSALYNAEHRFGYMQRPGRQLPSLQAQGPAEGFIGSEIQELVMPAAISSQLLRNTSFTAQVALATLSEAWDEANLAEVDPSRIGLIIGGSNVQQRDQTLAKDRLVGKERFVRPTHAMSFMDTDIAGLCSEAFGIKGFAYSLGGASASGQLAVIKAKQAVDSGLVDVCIAVGALMDLSYWECQSLRSLGAMGSTLFSDNPELACRPFDTRHDGFIYGESCAAIVVERVKSISRQLPAPKIYISGVGLCSDGNRQPHPSLEGEVTGIQQAMAQAQLTASDINYVNPHGSGSVIGDEVEVAALNECGLTDAHINTTKSIVGHGLSAAGAVEIAVTVEQMKRNKLHPSRNLVAPIDGTLPWVVDSAAEVEINNAMSLSLGFGGINTAICLSKT